MNRREEVAKKLRKIGDEMGSIDDYYETAFEEIDAVIYNSSYDTFFQRLADLIDPVCYLVKSNGDDGIKYTCSNCGQFHVKELQLLNGFKYCPVCGARIERHE